MNISSHEEYGLRCALRLAEAPRSEPLSASKIAEQEAISVEYVSKFMHLLRKSGLVLSVRGLKGGFRLAKAPEEIRVKELLDALSTKPSKSGDFCQQFAGRLNQCANHEDCSIRPLWSVVTEYFEVLVSRLSLSDFLGSENQVQEKVRSYLFEYLSECQTMEQQAQKEIS